MPITSSWLSRWPVRGYTLKEQSVLSESSPAPAGRGGKRRQRGVEALRVRRELLPGVREGARQQEQGGSSLCSLERTCDVGDEAPELLAVQLVAQRQQVRELGRILRLQRVHGGQVACSEGRGRRSAGPRDAARC